MKTKPTKQERYQKRHARLGLCRLCSEKRVKGRKLCKGHLEADASRKRTYPTIQDVIKHLGGFA